MTLPSSSRLLRKRQRYSSSTTSGSGSEQRTLPYCSMNRRQRLYLCIILTSYRCDLTHPNDRQHLKTKVQYVIPEPTKDCMRLQNSLQTEQQV
ncbi:unnamed protein product [Macrosiphum euphorbiae]|uniref:Uncharacterized protein n=1 Tax=Macrosiphum euphorbiae TaxID=13131 RepID=A0AAV0XAL2_9HEMI|nr:unnamed protein product [Macrosiphum euphorbiae]